MRIYGPYTRKDGRKHIIILDAGKRRTISYPRYLVKCYLNVSLGTRDTVDHIDGDYTNNWVSNLRIIGRSEHMSEDSILSASFEAECVLCGAKLRRRPNFVRHSAKQGKAGPFCSKRCAGRYGSLVQHGKMTRLPASTLANLRSDYYRVPKGRSNILRGDDVDLSELFRRGELAAPVLI